ncbi:hypothetical protein H4582DRAFT_2081671 [Lactarius indigo]|nr:hypothetical protein H4582DRAFT_2081671 [Lactarius indigo]
MLPVSAPECAASTYDATEGGTLEVHSGPSSVSTLARVDSKKVHRLVVPEEAIPIPLPPTNRPPAKKKVSRWILWQLWFNTYRKLFGFVFTLNMFGIGLAASGHLPYAEKYAGTMTFANLNFAILMRNELFGRFLYLFVNTYFAKVAIALVQPLFRIWCLSLSVAAAMVEAGLYIRSSGGIHSGCALSGIGWFTLKVVNNFRHHSVNHNYILVIGTITNISAIVTAMSAFPWVRNTHHNVFERHHRFVGWLSLVLIWVFTILEDSYNPDNRSWKLSCAAHPPPAELLACSLTPASIIAPWLCVREVPVDIELPSPKVAIIRFKRGMQQGLLGRISHTPIMEYHIFGIVSEGTHAEYHYMICAIMAGLAGDFTRGLVNNPPRTLWTRELKFAGVSNTSTLYKRGIRICTGTGIGAALSTCLQSPHWYLIWIGSDQEKTFGPTISGLVHRHIGPERLLLWDSKLRGGRPDTMRILKEVYYTWDAEVVFITSNYVGNSEIMRGCKEAGIPAFGTLWDFVSVVFVVRTDIRLTTVLAVNGTAQAFI